MKGSVAKTSPSLGTVVVVELRTWGQLVGWSLGGGVCWTVLAGTKNQAQPDSCKTPSVSSLCGYALQPMLEEEQAVFGHVAFVQ